jgi:hypothetical protein
MSSGCPPRWIKADPDDPTTWPEDQQHVITFHARPGFEPRRREGIAWRHGFCVYFSGSAQAWGTSGEPWTLHWMPWSAIGDPQ